MSGDRLAHLVRFYQLLDTLEKRCGGKRTLAQCQGRRDWPARGVYFFFEPGEERTASGTGARVVRVGTHAVTATSKTTLWNRLSQHRGTVKSGGGNHRGSIFRLLIGEALARRDPSLSCLTWGQGSSASAQVRQGEQHLESFVSRYIGSMPFLWFSVTDAASSGSKRGYIERNAIALLSNFGRDKEEALDLPSRGWLGWFSGRATVMNSGLWNQKHVTGPYDPTFLEALADLTALQE